MSDDLSIVRDVLGEELSPDSIDTAVRNARSVIPRLVQAWYPRAATYDEELPARRPGELSYFIPESNWGAFDRGQEVSLAYERGLTALLYVHRIVLNSPLLMLSSAAHRRKPLDWCRDLLFTALHLLLSLKELIDAGVVVIISSDGNYFVPALHGDTSSVSNSDPFELRLRSRIELSPASGCAVDIFACSDAEYRRLQEILGELQGILGEDACYGLASRSDAVHLSVLLDEVLPDATDLDLGEVLRIRQDDTFEQWRADLRAAIRQMIVVNSTAGLEGEGSEEMRNLLHEKAIRISEAVTASRSMAKLRNHAASFVIGGIGAASMVPIVGETTAISEVAMLSGSLGVGALSEGLAAVARSLHNQNAGVQALAHHYAFLGKCAKLVSVR